jgi:hypothetical protein
MTPIRRVMRWPSPVCPSLGGTEPNAHPDRRRRSGSAARHERARSARFVGRSSLNRCTRSPFRSSPRRSPPRRSLRSRRRTGHELRLRGVWRRRCRLRPGPGLVARLPDVAAAGSRAHVPDGTLSLTSVTRCRVVLGPSLTARCKPSDTGTAGPGLPTLDGAHHAPQAGCSCGIYGWYAPADAGKVSARVFGVVEASGLSLIGGRGFRTPDREDRGRGHSEPPGHDGVHARRHPRVPPSP